MEAHKAFLRDKIKELSLGVLVQYLKHVEEIYLHFLKFIGHKRFKVIDNKIKFEPKEKTVPTLLHLSFWAAFWMLSKLEYELGYRIESTDSEGSSPGWEYLGIGRRKRKLAAADTDSDTDWVDLDFSSDLDFSLD